MKNLLILNTPPFHFEIIETVIVKYHEILNIDKTTEIDIYINLNNNERYNYKKYINDKYPKIKFGSLNNPDFYINCSIYDKHFSGLDKGEGSSRKYISHDITDRLKTNPNVLFLTPISKANYLYADILPFTEEKKVSRIPIYIVQGNLSKGRRLYSLLSKILDQSYNHKFIFKLIGLGNFPAELNKHKNKIVFKNKLDFIDYHKEFLDGYCILPLISKQSHPRYYDTKLTSTINYARGYKLKCLIDEDLQEIYNLDNVEVYRDINDIVRGFTKTLENFYKNIKT